MSGIRVAFFDIGNVLLRFEVRAVLRTISAAVRRHPLRVGRLLWTGGLVDRIERGQLSSRALFRIFQKELEFEGDFAAFRKLWCDHFALDRGAAGLLQRVCARMPVYLLSNTNRLHFQFIEENYRFPALVAGAALSYRLGLRKPEAGICQAALAMAKAKPQEAVFIDDLAENVRGARRVGMNALRYQGAARLEADLKELGVL